MFGTNEKFAYLECEQCKSIQLLNPPEDISKYYPDTYVNFKPAIKKKKTPFTAMLKLFKAGIMINYKWYNLPGVLLRNLNPDDFISRLAPARINLTSKILDLGAGNGERILRLYERGFRNVSGIDPFIEKDLVLSERVTVFKKDIFQISGQFDCIMLNHSFEHMPNPKEILIRLNELVPIGSSIIIRIPVADSYSWKHYKENWVALDPPRHFFLHTEKSIRVLAEATGFTLNEVLFDSMEYQFIASEQLKQGIKLHDKRSYYINKEASVFSAEDIRNFKKKARKLNREKQGDAACFYLKKTRNATI
jgi:SAM-dependent methyltransferase